MRSGKMPDLYYHLNIAEASCLGAGSDRLIKTVYYNLQGGYMEYKNVTKTNIGVATGKPIRLILNFGKRKELRDFRNSLIRDNSCLM